MVLYAAGVLPITWHQGVLLFLVGKDIRDGSYSDFGGKCERYDRNDVVSTACREFVEETYNTIIGAKQLRSRLTPTTSVVLKGNTQNNHNYFMFVTPLPYQPHLRNCFGKVLAFLRAKNLQRMFVEKTDIAWVTLNTLRSMPKRSVFAGTLDLHAELLDELASLPAANWRALCEKHKDAFDSVAP